MKIKLNSIIDQLNQDCDTAIVDEFYKLAKSLVDTNNEIDTTSPEFQLLVKDFIEGHLNDYQIDCIKNVLGNYYDTNYDIKDEITEALEEEKEELSTDEIREFEKYMYNEIEIDRHGEITYIPDYEDIIYDYDDRISRKLYDETCERLKITIATVKYYDEDYVAYIELSDNHTLWEIDNEEFDDDSYSAAVLQAADQFEEETGEKLYFLGRSARHVCVEDSLENAENYEDLQKVQQKYENDIIETFNKKPTEESLSESKELSDEEAKLRQEMIDIFVAEGKSEEEATNNVDELIKLYKDNLVTKIHRPDGLKEEGIDDYADKLSVNFMGKIFKQMRKDGWDGDLDTVDQYFDAIIEKLNKRELDLDKEPIREATKRKIRFGEFCDIFDPKCDLTDEELDTMFKDYKDNEYSEEEINAFRDEHKITESFNSNDFESKIPTNMRWKQYNDMGNELYWVTQQQFNEKDCEQFQKALKDTQFNKAYVTTRDFSTYQFDDDKDHNVFAIITPDEIDMTDYIKTCKEAGWIDEDDKITIANGAINESLDIDNVIQNIEDNKDVFIHSKEIQSEYSSEVDTFVISKSDDANFEPEVFSDGWTDESLEKAKKAFEEGNIIILAEAYSPEDFGTVLAVWYGIEDFVQDITECKDLEIIKTKQIFEEVKMTDEEDAEEFNDESEEDDIEEKSAYDLLQDRIGEKITVGEFNAILQSIFGKYNEVFLLISDLYNMNPDELQELTVFDDEDMYTINYKIDNIEEGIIEITDVNME